MQTIKMTHLQNKKLYFTIVYLIVPVLLFVLICTSCTTKRIEKDAKILVIHSYRDDFASYPEMNRMIIEDLERNGINPRVQTYYLDCDVLTEQEELEVLYQYVDTMKVKPEIILTTDDQASYSLLSCKHPYLKKIPIVFTGVNFPNWDLLQEYPNVTGIWDKLNYIGNVEMIEKLMGYQRIRFYYDKTYIGRKILGDLAEQIGNRDKELYNMIQIFLQNPDTAKITRTEYKLGFLNQEELSSELKATRFYFLNLREVQGTSLLWCINGKFDHSVSLLTRYDYTMSRIGRMATIPTFSTVNKGVGYGQGILGGYFMTLEEQVREGCDYVAQILKGKAISSLPVKEGRKSYILDWKEMERWNMKKSDVGNDFQIINMPFYVEYRVELIVLCTVLGGAIISIICYLLFLFVRESKRKKQVQQTLKDEKEFLSLVLEGGNIYTWSYDRTREQFTFDRDFVLNVGMVSEKITLSKLVKITHPDDVENAINKFIDVVNRKEDKATVCARVDFNASGYVWYEFRVLGLPERRNSNVAVIGAVLSVQDFKKHEEELIIARDLAAKTELKQSFLANMSHEIRTPLNAIVGFSNILVSDDEIDEGEKREFITTINTNCELLLKLINDILEISRIESGNMSFVFEDCSINKLVEDIYQMNYLTVPPAVSFIKETLAEDIVLSTDSARLKQVLVNFVNNAFKFTVDGYVKIGVEYYNHKDEICLYVEDTGKGISEAEQRMIFERFYKCDEFVQGTGLGLSICSVIADKLKGRIILESEEDKGSRFGIVLSCMATQSDTDIVDEENVTEDTGDVADDGRPVVLIAEDSVSNYMVLSRILKKHFTILWALNGRDALDIVNRQHVDLVLMDIKMQEMDGLTALKKIRKNNKRLPVIIQTAYAYEENREMAKKAGCTDFIEKPIHTDILMQAVEKYISAR